MKREGPCSSTRVREGWYWDQRSLLDQLGRTEHPGLFLTHEDS
jgi:hypothetical protein